VSNNQYLSMKEANYLKKITQKLAKEKKDIYEEAYIILNGSLTTTPEVVELKKKYPEYTTLLENLYTGTVEKGDIYSVEGILREIRKQGTIEKGDCYRLREIAYGLSSILDDLKNIDLAIKLPSKVTLDQVVTNEKNRLIEKAKNDEANTPTDLSKFTTLVDYELDDALLPYTKLCLFMDALPFSLDPKDPRYISLSNTPMMLGEDTKRFNHYKVTTLTATGTDLIKEMGTWSDTVRASIQMKRYLAFQQYLEGNIDGFNATIKELIEYPHIQTNTEFLVDTAKNISTKEGSERIRMLAIFYQTMQQQYGNMYGFRKDIGLWINVYISKNIEPHFRKIEYQTMTALEETFMKIEDMNFDNDFIEKVYGISPKRIDGLLKINMK
jgi:hypothetical protein